MHLLLFTKADVYKRQETESVSESESESEKETTKLSEYLEGLADVYIEVGSSKVDYMDGLKYDKKVITGIAVSYTHLVKYFLYRKRTYR